MTRRGGRLTRAALRLGLLLGGVAVAWGAHEIANAAAAHAAERPPAVDRLTDVLNPVLDRVKPLLSPGRAVADPHRAGSAPAPTGRADRPRERSRPDHRADTRRADRRAATPRERSRPRPGHRADPRKGGHRAAPAARPGSGRDDGRRAGPERDRGAPPGVVVTPVRARVLEPVTGALRPVIGRLRHGEPAPAAGDARPVGPGVLTPVGRVLAPISKRLPPGLDPVWQALKRLGEPLGHALEAIKPAKPSKPVTGVPDPPAGPVTAPPAATPSPPAAERTTPDEPTGPVDEPGRTWAGAVGADAHGSAVRRPADATAVASPEPAGAERPRLPRPDRDRAPATPVPAGNGGVGSSGAAHGDTAATSATVWVPPILTGRRCHAADGPARASHSPRPGTRPA
ncbi:hypothetical protein GCE86_12575 [Micromonospora terminaliae]|uniref:Uncharacterized protein n=1 Tax=Micromonospora terminaliae TaxID=1914461 RepID=A0AAJ2ZDG6_9ACTN|nr:hypothetical protein [Micromonospora terminaliae]NES27476.1 hypothetical protein [Micromonospora terminaliae]QGL47784.1 hypothetical protein GCE86_12575 [Micromonospora terminaliae]